MNRSITSLTLSPKLLAFKKNISQKKIKHANVNKTKIEAISYSIQQQILGYQAIQLVFESGDVFNADSMRGRVTLGMDLVDEILSSEAYKNSKALITFVLAHELSHIFQSALESRSTLKIDRNYYRASHVMHLEVDGYALLILKRLKLQLPEVNDLSRLFYMTSRPGSNLHRGAHKYDFLGGQLNRCSDEMREEFLEKFKSLRNAR